MKISLVSLAEISPWQSCRSITQGLRLAYRRMGKTFEIREHLVSGHSSEKSIRDRAREISDGKPDLIAFLDTWPFYGALLFELSRIYERKPRPTLRFHTYGDFTLKAGQWLSWEGKLRQFPVEWVCASEAQKGLVETLTGPGEGRVWVCPFPVPVENFAPSPAQRLRWRKILGIGPKEICLLYTGRFSLQKNVAAACKAFSFTSRDFQRRAQFFFVGDPDDINMPFAGPIVTRGRFYENWREEISALPQALRSRIHLLPGMPNLALAGLYNAADAFCSLSLVHDEDFGMAPAEAAACGLPLILTEWGGYQGFRNMKLDGSWIPVTLRDGSPEFCLSRVTAALESVTRRSQAARLSQARKVSDLLSVPAIGGILRAHTSRLNPCPFHGFSPMMRNLSSYFDPHSKALIYPLEPGKGSTYEAIYQNYISP